MPLYPPAGGGGSGIVDSVVAGNNIDVDATDPANPIVAVETLTPADIGLAATVTELDYVDGVTSAIQTQIDAKQPLDSDLTTIAGLTATTDNFMVATASAWASRTPSQARTQMGLGTIATLAAPSGAVVGTSDTQTLTNKTLTTPIIGAISNSAGTTALSTGGGASGVNFVSIVNQVTGTGPYLSATGSDTNVDLNLFSKGSGLIKLNDNTEIDSGSSIATNTIVETTAASGVTIDGLLIKDNYIVGSATTGVRNSSLSSLAGEPGAAWATWTPTLSGRLDDGDWTKAGKYQQIGKTCNFRLSLTATAAAPAGGGSGEFTLTLPVTTVSYGGTATLQPIGNVMLFDATGTRWEGCLYWASTTTAHIRYRNVSGTGIVNAACSATVPFTWTTSDEIHVIGAVEAA